jgi:hypothetical protein
MRENPDGFPSSAGASRGPAPIPVDRWDLIENLKQATLGGKRGKVATGRSPVAPATLD